MKDDNFIFPFMCVAKSYKSEKDAWGRFDRKLKNLLGWIRGYKYWRVLPISESLKDFEFNTEIFKIYSRIIASKKRIKGLQEVRIGQPYKSNGGYEEEYSRQFLSWADKHLAKIKPIASIGLKKENN